MPVFAFEALKNDGQKVKSEVTADSKDEAIKKMDEINKQFARGSCGGWF